MPMGHTRLRRTFSALCALVVALCTTLAVAAAPVPAHGALDRQSAFAAAAQEFGVPVSVLLAVSYNLSRWEDHGGAPSFGGGYGPMHLTHLDQVVSQAGKGDDARAAATDTRGVASLHTLNAAAALLHISADQLQNNPTQNIRGGAALLAFYARGTNGALPAGAADWYSAVMRYSHLGDTRAAASFADAVYATIKEGASRTTDDGQAIVLAASNVVPNKPASVTALAATASPSPECPSPTVLHYACVFTPAAYAKTRGGYGNYDLASRPAPPAVRYIVIHDVEGTAASAISAFQDPSYGASAHYVIDTNGQITQMVETKNVAWHAGNWYINGHAIGIEHAGFAISGATWYSDAIYQESAKLVAYLAAKYGIPLDRAHIIGHDDIPGPTASYQSGMHWDPGPFWDWSRYMDLIVQAAAGSSASAPSAGSNQNIVTLRVSPSSNTQTVKDCEGNGASITQGTSFVYLRSAPSTTAPYITDPYLGSIDPLCANNWGDKAASGQTFYRFDTATADWDGIYFGGQKAYFYNPGHSTYTVTGQGTPVTAKASASSISVYGRAYPESSAYPRGVTAQSVVAFDRYSIPAGQVYVAFGPFASDYFSAPQYTTNPANNKDIVGTTQYYQVFYNHRFVFVQAANVAVAP